MIASTSIWIGTIKAAIQFFFNEALFFLLVGGCLIGLAGGAVMAEYGFWLLFLPPMDDASLTSCDPLWTLKCFKVAGTSLLESPAFVAFLFYAILTAVLFTHWLDATSVLSDRRPWAAAVLKDFGTDYLLIKRIASVFIAQITAIAVLLIWIVPLSDRAIGVGLLELQSVFGIIAGSAVSILWLKLHIRKDIGSAKNNSYAAAIRGFGFVGGIAIIAETASGPIDLAASVLGSVSLIYLFLRFHATLFWVSCIAVSILFFGQLSRLDVLNDSKEAYRIGSIDSAIETPDDRPLLRPVQRLDSFFQGVTSPKIVVVSASGGAYRATFWTAAVLDRILEQSGSGGALEGIQKNLFLFTGASGGMITNAYVVAGFEELSAWRQDGGITRAIAKDIQSVGDSRMAELGRVDSVEPVAAALVDDMKDIFLARPLPPDRGQVLETQWPLLQSTTFTKLLANPRRPEIIFQPTIANNGAPLFITNLDLGSDVAERSLFAQVPAARDGLTLANAARLSASFPIISPVVDIPLPAYDGVDVKVVDAGYFDNIGTAAVAEFIAAEGVVDWLRDRNAQILHIRIFSQPPGWADLNKIQDGVSGLFDWILVPMSGYSTTRANSFSMYDARARREIELQLGQSAYKQFTFMNTNEIGVPMTWRVDTLALSNISDQIEAHCREFKRLAENWQPGSSVSC